MNWRESTLGHEIELAYGKSLPEAARRGGEVPVYGSNGIVGWHDDAMLPGPGIVVGRKGSVGAVNFSERPYWPIDTTYYVVNKGGHDWSFLRFLLLTLGLDGMNGHAVVPGLNRETAYAVSVLLPGKDEQVKIATVLEEVQMAVETEADLVRVTRELKQAALREFFTRGLRGEPQKQTDLGPLPEGWDILPLGECCSVLNSSMSYTELLQRSEDVNDGVACHGIKVSDMNLQGNELSFIAANLSRKIPRTEAERRTVPAQAVVFPKRGAAIATNKKRMTTQWTVLDPNLIAVTAGPSLLPWFLFQWFQGFDLRAITEPGPTPQLNKKNLTPLLLPVPKESEQREIAARLAAIDAKLAHHEARQKLLRELFRTLLRDLMTAKRRVGDLDLSALTS